MTVNATDPPKWVEIHIAKRFDDLLDAMRSLNENIAMLIGQYRSLGTAIGSLDSRVQALEEELSKHRVRMGLLETKVGK